MAFEVEVRRKVAVKYLKADIHVRYWEDGEVDGAQNERMPLRTGDNWNLIIDLATGVIEKWPDGTTAGVHYKVCDEGRYALLDADRNEVVAIEGYVPQIMCPKDQGYGDYIIMDIDGNGRILNWRVDLSGFEPSDD